ncbi:MAG: DUF1214 domain-containing protein, partial [Rubrobacter sp.]|nr:DUF1214 domain-containing protein [Rubrobacter sp.]
FPPPQVNASVKSFMSKCSPLNQIGMLHDYVTPDQKFVACPNQDGVYGFGILSLDREPVIVQVPDFGDRFWVFQLGDQRTDGFGKLGKVYGSEPGFYLLVGPNWDGTPPEGIREVSRSPTNIGYLIPRIFMDDTADDREAIQPLVNQVMAYPLSQFTGEMKTKDWTRVPSFSAGQSSGDEEIQWVVPEAFFDVLPQVLDEVPPLPGEASLYAWVRSILEAAEHNPSVGAILTQAAQEADEELIAPIFQFRNIGVPALHGWTTPKNPAAFGTAARPRTAVAKANIFVNMPRETSYFYQDLDSNRERLHGNRSYTVIFADGELPPVQGFWSLTLYNEHHFFHPNELNRYSLGTKNKNLRFEDDGSLTLYVQAQPPQEGARSNWLPAPEGDFSLYLRAYWPEDTVLDGQWSPPAVIPSDC